MKSVTQNALLPNYRLRDFHVGNGAMQNFDLHLLASLFLSRGRIPSTFFQEQSYGRHAASLLLGLSTRG